MNLDHLKICQFRMELLSSAIPRTTYSRRWTYCGFTSLGNERLLKSLICGKTDFVAT
jgi:hypothetical protein